MTGRTKTVTIVAVLLLLGVCALLVVGVYSISSKRTALLSLMQARAEAEASQLQLASLSELVEETADKRAELRGYILNEDSVIDLLSLIETVGNEQGVDMDTRSIATRALANETNFEELVMNIEVSGSLDSVLHVLSVIETLPYQSNVGRVSLQRAQDDGVSLWKGSFDIAVTKYISS